MILNFAMVVTGRLVENYCGQAESCQEFRDRYEAGEFRKDDDSEVEMEELYVTDFMCPLCQQLNRWIQVDGPNKECYIECKACKATFAVGMNDCVNCVDREVKCIAVIP